MSTQLFATAPLESGGRWLAAIAAGCGLAFLGWRYGYLQESCLALIAGLVLLRGILPFASIAKFLVADAAGSKAEVELLQDIEVTRADELLEAIGEDSCSAMRMFEAEVRNADRLPRGVAAHGYVDGLVSDLKKSSAVPELTGEICPLAGLGGSLIGLGTALPGLSTLIQRSGESSGNAEIAEVFSSFGTVTSTTLAGCIGAAVCLGLHSILEQAISKHECDLRRIADGLARGVIDFEDDDANENGDDELYNLYGGDKQ